MLFENKKKIDKLTSKLTKKEKKLKFKKLETKKEDTIIDTPEIQRIMRDYYDQSYAHTLGNLPEIDKFLKHSTYQD